MKIKHLILFITLTVMQACSTGPERPSPEQFDKANYGPSPKDWQKTIKEKMEFTLIDPDSAKYRFLREPVKNWKAVMGNKGLFSTDFRFGWTTCFGVNAKNTLGGYTGYKTYFAMIKYDNVIILWDGAMAQVNCY